MSQRPFRPRSLRRQFARAMLLGVLIPALLMIAGLVWFNLSRERAGIDQRTRSVAVSAARDVDEFLAAHQAALNVLAQRRTEEGSADSAEGWSADLARLRRNYPGFLTVLVTDRNGQVRSSDPAPRVQSATRGSVADRPYFTVPARTGQPYVSDAFRGRGLGTDPLIAIAAPLRDADGFAGVVEGSVRTDTIAAARIGALHQRGYEVLLVDGSGRVIQASPGTGLASLDPVEGSGFEAMLGTADAGDRMQRLRGVLASSVGEERDAYAARADLGRGWQLLVLVPKQFLDREVAARVVAPIVLMLVFVLGILAASVQQMRTLQRGINGLVDTLRGFALGGTLSSAQGRAQPRELQPIVAGVRELGDRLNVAYGDLQQALEGQRELAESRQQIVATREAEIETRTKELREAVSELDRISRTDALTGCLNYRGYKDVARGLWKAAGDGGQPLSVLAIDIDWFKAYNDRYGHQAGDNALRRFAGAVRSSLYGADDTLVRTGGEEFVVLLPRTSLAKAVEVADRVRESVVRAGIIHEDAPRGMLTVSVGVATRDAGDGDDPDAMLRRADDALYQAKYAGRDRTSVGA